jgi:protocatechuate 3,4-dioxygenase beta subunit
VTNTATVSLLNGDKAITASGTTTITCEYAEGWIPYAVDPNESLEHIVTWYPDKTETDLQKANCMGSSTIVVTGQTLYVPSPPPLATISGFIRDTSGQPLANTPVTLINTATGSSLTERTGAFGEYTFSGLGPGTYKIFQVRITVRHGDHATQGFTIIPGQP